MKKKFQLIYDFCKRYVLINRHIIIFAGVSLKNIINKETFECINNSILYEDIDNELIIGPYENEYCLEFLKKVRTRMFHDFFKYQGKFCVTLKENQYHGLMERLSEYALSKCEFEFNKEYCGGTVVYTVC